MSSMEKISLSIMAVIPTFSKDSEEDILFQKGLECNESVHRHRNRHSTNKLNSFIKTGTHFVCFRYLYYDLLFNLPYKHFKLFAFFLHVKLKNQERSG